MSYTNQLFIAKVREMRAMQKQYFKTRNRAVLNKSMALEREVDGMLENSDPVPSLFDVRRCRKCGCTDEDCSQCIEKTGAPCHWVEADLCSACK